MLPLFHGKDLTIVRFFGVRLLNPGIDERLASKILVDRPQKRAVAQGVSTPIAEPMFVTEMDLHQSYRVSWTIDRRIELVALADIDGACPSQIEADRGDSTHSG
ncbi:hypothetical protein [Rhizobium wenxiniae]|uniref:hypothetical protein n=1 Tax=Rhizobium wenxiniae TaxID=1737357 RepID=UPI001FE5F898|nr:hypothetical protein [Rhizobium wenxiniae]